LTCPSANVVQIKRPIPRNPTRNNLIRCDVMFSTAYTRLGRASALLVHKDRHAHSEIAAGEKK
jgi:hypothetical protein